MLHRETIRLPEALLDVRLGGHRVVTPAPTAPPVDVEALTRAAYERGRLEGEQAVSEQLVRQRVEFSELQNGLLATLRGTFPSIAHESETTLIALALEAAQRLVASLPISAELVEAVVREAIAQANDTAELEVLVSPEDLRRLEAAQSPLLTAGTGQQKVQFTAASTVTPGGCLVHTRFGTVDATRETKLVNLRESMSA
ncbi:MAG: Yop protein translocation protein [Verrucomicrobiota bacterium]|jgi:flagellar assembly protein FliH